jgi:hypothetical protein
VALDAVHAQRTLRLRRAQRCLLRALHRLVNLRARAVQLLLVNLCAASVRQFNPAVGAPQAAGGQRTRGVLIKRSCSVSRAQQRQRSFAAFVTPLIAARISAASLAVMFTLCFSLTQRWARSR